MPFYNEGFVNQTVKVKLLSGLEAYPSWKVMWALGFVIYKLIQARHQHVDLTKEKEKNHSHSPDLDGLANNIPHDISQLASSFNLLLAEKGNFGSPRLRWIEGDNKISLIDLSDSVLSSLKKFTYPVQINTWAAVCEEWLGLGSIAWIENGQEWLRADGLPDLSDAEAMTRWIPGWVGEMYLRFYNRHLVDTKVKDNLLSIMAEGKSPSVGHELARVFYHLVEENRIDGNETSYSPNQDILVDCFPDGRIMETDFYASLSDLGEFDPPLERWPDGQKKIELTKVALPVLKELSYPQKINTWAAICEEFFRRCSFDSVREAKASGDKYFSDAPDDDMSLSRWMPKWHAEITWLY